MVGAARRDGRWSRRLSISQRGQFVPSPIAAPRPRGRFVRESENRTCFLKRPRADSCLHHPRQLMEGGQGIADDLLLRDCLFRRSGFHSGGHRGTDPPSTTGIDLRGGPGWAATASSSRRLDRQPDTIARERCGIRTGRFRPLVGIGRAGRRPQSVSGHRGRHWADGPGHDLAPRRPQLQPQAGALPCRTVRPRAPGKASEP